ncbi:MATH domain-containing protein [Endozoicomonas ascidiicola]|uniref:MATH domain-containing protein n=1 Tax=Endozoicomonas ascidiicola TaxID=1698521 RepID=UPI00082950A5|nr:MATH domain-containing protein [Endozoicomonas ascidiicola]
MALQQIVAKADLGIQEARLGISKADWIKEHALGNGFEDDKTTVTSMFNNVESHVGELEGKVEQLTQENKNKDQLLKELQESVDGLTAKFMAQAKNLSVLEHQTLNGALQRISKMESLQTKTTSYNGRLIWKIENFSQEREKAVKGEQPAIYSEPFYTSTYGYKLGLVAYLNGDGPGKRTHLSLFFIVYKGEYDALLNWPFNRKVTLELISQDASRPDLTDSFKPDKSDSYFRPLSNSIRNKATGCPLFVSLDVIEEQNIYQKNGVVLLGARVETQSRPASVSQQGGGIGCTIV